MPPNELPHFSVYFFFGGVGGIFFFFGSCSSKKYYCFFFFLIIGMYISCYCTMIIVGWHLMRLWYWQSMPILEFVWYMYLKTENCYLKIFMKIHVGEDVCENAWNVVWKLKMVIWKHKSNSPRHHSCRFMLAHDVLMIRI